MILNHNYVQEKVPLSKLIVSTTFPVLFDEVVVAVFQYRLFALYAFDTNTYKAKMRVLYP